MDLESTSSPGSGFQQIPHAGQRKERGAIAAQACDTCRLRKQKCDEQRPKCGLCQRMKLECRYREPQPTKKDKTLVEILDRLKSLESKVDRLPTRPQAPNAFRPTQVSPASQPSFSTDERSPYSTIGSSVRESPRSVAFSERDNYESGSNLLSAGGSSNNTIGGGNSTSGRSSSYTQPYRHASAAHKMLTWPAIRQMLISLSPSVDKDLQSLDAEGSAFIVHLQKNQSGLPPQGRLNAREFKGMLTQATRTTSGDRFTFPDISLQEMNHLATVYFDSFNLLYPFMDRQVFFSDVLAKVSAEGFNGDAESVIALLVFALGELAEEGIRGQPINLHRGRHSGIRGGTLERPPGLTFFNEARKRLGFVLTDCDLENVQILSLAALYYQSCSRHVEFWRMTVSASLACQVLITCNITDWGTQKGDLIKRAFWHCAIMETGLHLELDLPLTGIIKFCENVGLPTFDAPFCEADHKANEYAHFEHHFASQIALRRLCADLHQCINDSMSALETPQGSSSGSEEFVGPTTTTLKQLAGQLDQWRLLLPRNLRWKESDPASFPLAALQPNYAAPLDPHFANIPRSPRPEHPGQALFSADLDFESEPLPYVYNIQVALLRTRYYYARYMVHRPFVYKALHFPDHMTQEDAEGVAECLTSCLRWPLAMAPVSRQKRLVPYLFCWSSNFLGMLLIFHMTRVSPILRQIRLQLCGPNFDRQCDASTELMIDWIRDLKEADPIAKWAYGILRPVYNLAP